MKTAKHNIYLYTVGSLLGVTVAVMLTLVSLSSVAYAEVDEVSARVPSSCTFTAGGGSYNAEISGGSGSTEVNANSITTSCNDVSGYAIYAVGYSGDSYSGTNTDLIYSTNTNYNIKTDGSSSTGSSWKMKLTVANNAEATIAGSYGSYQNIPSSLAKVAQYGSNTTSGTITPHYQINVTAGQPAGTYSGKVKYVLVHPSTMVAGTYTIAYNANGGSGSMTSSTGNYNFETFTLPASTFTAPSGYQFAGWCTTNTAGSYACDGTSYADEATLPASPSNSATANGTLTLYAYWEEIPVPGLCTDLATCMQTATACDTPLVDSRTGVSYLTATINNQCYMEQNLYLPTNLTLTSADSNVTRDWTTPASSTMPSNSYDNAYMVTGTHTNNTYNVQGGWYNYCAASAGTVCSETEANASEDICPAGWRLPTNTEMGYVRSANRSNWKFSAGYYSSGSLQRDSSISYWWSATAYDANYQESLYYSHGSLDPNVSNKYVGYFVRCVRN